MHFSYKPACQAFIAILLLLSLNACLVGPDFKPMVTPDVKHYTAPPWHYKTVSASGHAGASQHFIQSAIISPQWWRSFHSKKLNKIVCRGVAHSPNLVAAKAVLRQAQENLNAGIGGLYPAFTAQLSAQRGSSTGVFNSNTPGATITGSNIALKNIFNLFNASVNVSYLLDIFGGTRREIEALKAKVDYQDYELKAAYLSLTGNIVTSTIALASLQTQIYVTKQLISEQEEQLRIIRQQFKLGGASGVNLLAQETQVAQTRATLPPLEKSKDQTRHTLAVLVGSLPCCSCIPRIYLSELKLPTQLPLSVASALVRHRPDVSAAEALWRVANAQVGVATANLYPQFTINASYGESSSVASGLFGSHSKVWSLGGGLLQPLLKGGTLIAQRRAAFAAYDQAAAQYQQVMLQAFQNVADTLRALEVDARELRVQKHAELASLANLNVTRQQYKLGGVNYLSLLDAQRQYHQTRISLIQAQASRFTDTAALYQALGGGWWNC